MPTYEYKCLSCNHTWDCEQKMSDPALKKCPKCKKNKAQRQISGGLGFQLLGSGWAKDNYK